MFVCFYNVPCFARCCVRSVLALHGWQKAFALVWSGVVFKALRKPAHKPPSSCSPSHVPAYKDVLNCMRCLCVLSVPEQPWRQAGTCTRGADPVWRRAGAGASRSSLSLERPRGQHVKCDSLVPLRVPTGLLLVPLCSFCQHFL